MLEPPRLNIFVINDSNMVVMSMINHLISNDIKGRDIYLYWPHDQMQRMQYIGQRGNLYVYKVNKTKLY